MEALSPRRGQILKYVIEDYVTTASPVSSDALVRKYVPRLSSATVRNELAALEGLGYLAHPHTSSGRVPSDLGYRYYVEWLMGGARLSETEERTISHQFHQVEFEVDQWVRLAGTVLSSAVQIPVMVSAPSARTSRLRHLDLVRIGPDAVLLVAVLNSGAVRQQVLRMEGEISSDELVDLVSDWNDAFSGLSAGGIEQAQVATEYRVLHEALVRLLWESDRQFAYGGADVRVEGISYMVGQPEFDTGERLQPVVEALERQGVVSSLMEPLMRSEGVVVAIGREQPIERLRDCTVILARYGRPEEMLGVVGVIGPTRLAYWRAVPMVSYVASVLDRLLEQTFLS